MCIVGMLCQVLLLKLDLSWWSSHRTSRENVEKDSSYRSHRNHLKSPHHAFALYPMTSDGKFVSRNWQCSAGNSFCWIWKVMIASSLSQCNWVSHSNSQIVTIQFRLKQYSEQFVEISAHFVTPWDVFKWMTFSWEDVRIWIKTNDQIWLSES